MRVGFRFKQRVDHYMIFNLSGKPMNYYIFINYHYNM